MMNDTAAIERDSIPVSAYLAVAFLSGSILAYELFIMRVFAIGGWSHFGSTVISIAMFGFGVFSTALCIWKQFFARTLTFWINLALLLLGPAMLAVNSLAQEVPFNPIFLVSDPSQKYYLANYFLLYFVPFLLGAMFLGLFFLMGQAHFGKAYFANMAGSGLGGMVLFAAMYVFLPERLFLIPLILWVVGAVFWFVSQQRARLIPILVISAAFSLVMGWQFSQITISPYKGVSYARNFPDAKRVYQAASPFGYLEVYSSSYFHFAPGLSDAASLYLEKMPENAYLGMYIDGDGPIGIMKDLPEDETEYVKFLPLSMPYLLKPHPEVLVIQFGGGISTAVALKLGADKVTVAEGNPMIVDAVKDKGFIADFTGNILENPKVRLITSDGRIYVKHAKETFDIIDLSLADSTGLSSPGGSSIYEKYTYTTETFLACMRALGNDGIFSVTVWNKEDPPKSTMKLMTTLVTAAQEADSKDISRDFFIAHTYLSTFTALYKKGGFSEEEVQKLIGYCKRMSFEIVYAPGQKPPEGDLEKVFEAYRNIFFAPQTDESSETGVDMSMGNLYRLVASRLMSGHVQEVEAGYVFNSEPLTNERPYFAGYLKIPDLLKFIDRLDAISDEWGYLLLWATLSLSVLFGFILMLLPMIFGWQAFFHRHRGKLGVIIYFLCLGLGYIFVEIAMISKYILCLGNATVSIAILITGMLLFSGLGSYLSARFMPMARPAIVVICSSITVMLVLYAVFLDYILGLVGLWPYGAKIVSCLILLFPLAFLMGFPFALGMSTLSRLKKEHFFVWAWGINGSFSVAGSVLVPIISVSLGISTVILVAAVIYFAALPSFFHLQLPDS
jgi:spermidine synthase